MATFGESRVQEARAKVDALPSAEWHLVGRLQANKARAAVRAFRVIHSVDCVALLARLDRVAGEEQHRPDVLLQVNVTGEPSKAGFDAEALASGAAHQDLVAAIRAARHVGVVGLMTIAPLVARPGEARPVFARLRTLRDTLQQRLGAPLRELSMGMSGDLEAGVAEGATMVRVGTAIFGLRRR